MKPALLLLTLLASTLTFGQCCDYTLVGNDSYGDGWNGGYLNLMVNGVLVESFVAVDQGSSFTFQVCDDDAIEMYKVPMASPLITVESNQKAKILRADCTGCRLCVLACPTDAITMIDR